MSSQQRGRKTAAYYVVGSSHVGNPFGYTRATEHQHRLAGATGEGYLNPVEPLAALCLAELLHLQAVTDHHHQKGQQSSPQNRQHQIIYEKYNSWAQEMTQQLGTTSSPKPDPKDSHVTVTSPDEAVDIDGLTQPDFALHVLHCFIRGVSLPRSYGKCSYGSVEMLTFGLLGRMGVRTGMLLDCIHVERIVVRQKPAAAAAELTDDADESNSAAVATGSKLKLEAQSVGNNRGGHHYPVIIEGGTHHTDTTETEEGDRSAIGPWLGGAYMKEIHGRSGDAIDSVSLVLHTPVATGAETRRTRVFGGYGGNAFSIIAPKGMYIHSIGMQQAPGVTPAIIGPVIFRLMPKPPIRLISPMPPIQTVLDRAEEDFTDSDGWGEDDSDDYDRTDYYDYDQGDYY